MELLIAALVALLIFRKKDDTTPPKTKPSREGVQTNSGYTLPAPGQINHLAVLFWAHVTPAGFVCVGYANPMQVTVADSEQTIQMLCQGAQIIEPGFVDPTKMPKSNPGKTEGHKWGWKTAPDIALNMLQEIEPVEDGVGGYVVFQPLNNAGLLDDDYVAGMIFADDGIEKMRDGYNHKNKSFTAPRTFPFPRSLLFRVRSNNPFFSAYTFPILMEVSEVNV